MKHVNPIAALKVAHASGSSQSTTPDPSSDPNPDPVIPEQDLAPIKARVKEYILRHTRQTHHVFHSSSSTSSPSSSSSSSSQLDKGQGKGELHQTVQMLRNAQRINSDLWYVHRSLTDEKGVTKSQLHTQLLPKLEQCLKELDDALWTFTGGVKKQIRVTRRVSVRCDKRESEREEAKVEAKSNAKQLRQQQAWNRAKYLASQSIRGILLFSFNFAETGRVDETGRKVEGGLQPDWN